MDLIKARPQHQGDLGLRYRKEKITAARHESYTENTKGNRENKNKCDVVQGDCGEAKGNAWRG